MDLENLVVVSGWPGIYKMVANRQNGLVVLDLDSGKKKFAPTRKHQFSPLETIAVYTLSDTIPLRELFQKMKLKQPEIPVVAPESQQDDLQTYFKKIVPDYDDQRVFPRDIKRIVKWFHYLEERNMLTDSESTEEE
jgi:hypothetical protein